MHKLVPRLAAAFAVLAATFPLHAAPLPAGTIITGSVSGASSTMLGLDAGFADVPGSNVTALSATELEYLTGDYAVGVDLRTDGELLFYDNTGLGRLAGSYSFTFDFAGLLDPINGFALADVSSLSGGNVAARVLNGHAVEITLRDVAYTAPFASFSARVTTVPEPGTLALAGASLALLLAAGARKGEQR